MSLLTTLNFIVSHPLSKGRKLRRLSCFLRWQVGSRLVPGPVAFDFVNEAKLFARPGMTGATGNIYVGLHEFEDMAFVLHFLRRGDLFVDIGANIGSYTVLASACVGAHCIAFEPGRNTFRWLQRNVELNGTSNLVEAREEALGGEIGIARLSANYDTMNHIVPSRSEEAAYSVAVNSLDNALEGRSPKMLKIDVEGFETEVLRGAKGTLQDPILRCVLMELSGIGARYGFDEGALYNMMHENGFEEFTYMPKTRSLVRGATKTASGNTLFIRDLSEVSARVQAAPPFTVIGQTI